jgi:putative addiction module antidote
MPKVFLPRKVIKVGNSLAITIPTELLKSQNVRQGDEVAFIVEDGIVTLIDFQYTKNSIEGEQR